MRQYEKNGVLSVNDLQLPSEKQLARGVAILECIQEIPCNPCVDCCPVHAISMKDINAPPRMDFDACIGCSKCICVCPGLAIFLVKVKDDLAWVTLPYEFIPAPKVGQLVIALDRAGEQRGKARVTKVVKAGKTIVVTIEVKRSLAMEIRNIKV